MKPSNRTYAAVLYEMLKNVPAANRKSALNDFLKSLLKEPAKILAELETYIDEKNQVKRVTVTTARPLSGKQRDQVKKLVEKKVGANQIEMVEAVKPEIIGGIVLAWDDQTLDLSLAAKVRQLKTHLGA